MVCDMRGCDRNKKGFFENCFLNFCGILAYFSKKQLLEQRILDIRGCEKVA